MPPCRSRPEDAALWQRGRGGAFLSRRGGSALVRVRQRPLSASSYRVEAKLRTHGSTDRAAPTAVGGQAARDVVGEEGGSRSGGRGRGGSSRHGGWPRSCGRRRERLRGGRTARGPGGPHRSRAGGGRGAHAPQEGTSSGFTPRRLGRTAGLRRSSGRAYRRAWVGHPHGNGNSRDSGGTTNQPAQAGEGETRTLVSNRASAGFGRVGVQGGSPTASRFLCSPSGTWSPATTDLSSTWLLEGREGKVLVGAEPGLLCRPA